ncbi:hypothetical protein [Micromonospora avicenniae]|uniref:hypothetical protein n=1 Tax=Micromonospora avicenniae TaxID=1198245 RepID=UPI00344784CA
MPRNVSLFRRAPALRTRRGGGRPTTRAVTSVSAVLLVALLGPTGGADAGLTHTAAASHVEGALPDGSAYVMDVPANWNGTVLLYSHGYVPDNSSNPARNAPSDDARTALLKAGYAQIGSSYPETGWIVERALSDQLATLDRFQARFGPARRTIAWGTSMGGMITTGLAERFGGRFDGAVAMCGLEQGAVANYNSGLDTIFAIRTLLAPGSTAPLVRLPDQATALASTAELTAALDAAQATAQGRARIALAAALRNTPAWTNPAQPEPDADDYDTAQRNQFDILHQVITQTLTWRQDAEEHASGNMSWNTGVDYARILAHSPNRQEVEELYARSGRSSRDDLAALNTAPRITADPTAVSYMSRNISFTGRLIKPMMSIHTIGDPLVPVQAEQAYAEAARDAGRSRLLRQAYVHRAGHCTFTTGEMLAAVRTVEHRIGTGQWPDTTPGALNRRAAELDPTATHAYATYRPDPYPRPFRLPL